MEQDVRASEEVDVEPFEGKPDFDRTQALDDGVQDDEDDSYLGEDGEPVGGDPLEPQELAPKETGEKETPDA